MRFSTSLPIQAALDAGSVRRHLRRAAAAFSLLEVTLAISLASVCMLTVMGLLPVGLTVMRDAVDQTVESQIVQQLHAEILQTPYSRLGVQYAGKTFYFNEEGEAVTVQTDARYQVATSLTDPVYPGSAQAPDGDITHHIQTVRLDFARTRSNAVVVAVASRYNIQVPKSGD